MTVLKSTFCLEQIRTFPFRNVASGLHCKNESNNFRSNIRLDPISTEVEHDSTQKLAAPYAQAAARQILQLKGYSSVI